MGRKKIFWQTATFLGLVILFTSPLNSTFQSIIMKRGVDIPAVTSAVEASEIYPMFTCPCCDQPLNKEEPCCGAMIQMIDFIDQKVSTGASYDNVILATVQEFGLERLTNEKDRKVLRERLIALAPQDAPKITVSETKKDLGNVSRIGGIITTEFLITNEGKSDLIIDKLSSSCGCTSASVVYQNTEGPRFYMEGHGYKEADENWRAIIASGDKAKIKVYYDPTVHPDLTGPVTRTVSVHSNDPVDFEVKLTIILEQI